MVKRRSVLATLAAFVGGVFGLLGLGVAQISPWFDISRMIDIRDPVPLLIVNHDKVDHLVEVTITDRSDATVFEETVNIGGSSEEEPVRVELEDPVTTLVGEYRVTAELETGESGDYLLDPLDHVILDLKMPDELIVSIGSKYGPRSKVWVYGTGNPP